MFWSFFTLLKYIITTLTVKCLITVIYICNKYYIICFIFFLIYRYIFSFKTYCRKLYYNESRLFSITTHNELKTYVGIKVAYNCGIQLQTPLSDARVIFFYPLIIAPPAQNHRFYTRSWLIKFIGLILRGFIFFFIIPSYAFLLSTKILLNFYVYTILLLHIVRWIVW